MKIEEYLGSSFSVDLFNGFLREFFKHFEKVPYKECLPSDTFTNSIEKYAVHGTYTDPNGNEVIILSVRVKKNSNARQAHRNFISYLLTRTFSQYNAALVAFYDGFKNTWKLSLVTVDFQLGDKGIELRFKPAKRFTFSVGENEPSKTYKQQLSPVFDAVTAPLFEDIVEAFSVNRLSNDFYEDYKVKFFELVDHLISDEEFINESNRLGYDDPEKFAVTFAKKTLGQMVFLHFIQKRGWLGVKEFWGDGDKKYIIKSAKSFEGNNYFNDFVEPLFYNALNKKRDEDKYLGSKVPFLNGGLFYPIEDYDWENTDFHIPNDYWYNEEETGLLNILSQYNFTVDESDPSEQELAVDPEMLGKIFEKLLDVKDRSSLGAFFTPREIVHFMCEEALAERISRLIGIDSVSMLNYIRYGDALLETEYIESFAADIDEIVSNITIVDPAVGSGAFLVGMLNQIVKLRLSLQQFTKTHISKYEMKLQAIQNSLYGVDIEFDAIEIAKLRLWLSLIVDEDASSSAPQPLPNLSFHLRVGNSLIDSYEGIQLWNKRWKGVKKGEEHFKGQLNIFNVDTIANILFRLKAAKKQFFSTSDEKLKAELLSKIEREQLELIRAELVGRGQYETFDRINALIKKKTKPFFIWELEFEEVFESDGFDIVIANPPYIGEENHKKIFQEVACTEFGKKYYIGKMDFSYFFISKGIELLKENGVLTFITPNNWPTTAGGKNLRKHIAKESKLLKVFNFCNIMIFESASQQTMVFELTKEKEEQEYSLSYNEIDDYTLDSNSLTQFLHAEGIGKRFDTIFVPSDHYDGSPIHFLDDKENVLLAKISSGNKLHLNDDEVINGIHTHHDSVSKKMLEILPDASVGEGIFILSQEELDNLELNDNEMNLIKPYYDTDNIGRYTFNPINTHYIIYTDSTFKDRKKMNAYPIIKKHLDKYVKVITSDNKPYGLHRARKQEFFEGNTIFSLRKCGKPTFSFVEQPAYVSAKWYCIKTERVSMKYLVGLLNSSLIQYWLLKKGKMQGKNYQVDKAPIVSIPIVKPDSVSEATIEKLVDKIYSSKSNECKEIEKEIDAVIYKLYDVEDDIKYIEAQLKMWHDS